MDPAILLLALALLIAGAWWGISVLALAPALAVGAALASGEPGLASYTQVFMTATGGFVTQFLPLFLLGAVFGRLMEDSGAAGALAAAIARWLGAGRAISATVLACAALTYGGVSLFVVAFAAWPIARVLFAASGTDPRLIPAIIALGAFTFTMSALPGTPSIQNAIPIPHLGTDIFAAPLLGLAAGAVMLGFGLGWLGWRARRTAALAAAPPATTAEAEGSPLPAILAIIAVVAVAFVAGRWLLTIDTAYLAEPRWGATTIERVAGLWAIVIGLTVASGLVLAFGWRRLAAPGASISAGAEAAMLPLLNTASLVGFGAVMAALPGFEAIRGALDGLAGGDALVALALAINVLAAITGSASGGLSIALDVLGPTTVAAALAQGHAPELIHRVSVVATGALDALPHNGAVVSLLAICGMTHREAYPDIFVVAVVGPMIALVLLVGLGMVFGAV
jgi:H+/gluconate symporter-like permease